MPVVGRVPAVMLHSSVIESNLHCNIFMPLRYFVLRTYYLHLGRTFSLASSHGARA